jgi:phosphoribosylformylglycinamidine cyclo-ligase
LNISLSGIFPVFDLLQKTGDIPERDMYNTYNMGVGMSVVVAKEDAEKALEILKDNGEDAYVIGKIVKSDNKITLI